MQKHRCGTVIAGAEKQFTSLLGPCDPFGTSKFVAIIYCVVCSIHCSINNYWLPSIMGKVSVDNGTVDVSLTHDSSRLQGGKCSEHIFPMHTKSRSLWERVSWCVCRETKDNGGGWWAAKTKKGDINQYWSRVVHCESDASSRVGAFSVMCTQINPSFSVKTNVSF